MFVDLGYGFDARTTLESDARFRRVNPNLPILGVEIDKERVDAALPKNYIHHVTQGELIYDFFEAWKRSAAETASAKVFGLKQWFFAATENLAAKGYKIELHKKWLAKGWLIWNQ